MPTDISLNTQNITLDAIGATVNLTAAILDQNGDELTEATLSWSSDNESVATVNSSGTVTAVSNGTARITASSDGATGTATVVVDQVITQLQVLGGDAQTDTVGQTLADSLRVRARDRLGNGVTDRAISFSVVSSGGGADGTVDPADPETDADGIAAAAWTLGTAAGPDHEVTASGGPESAVTFTATALPDVSDSVEKETGDAQLWVANGALPDSVVVRVFDQFGNAIPDEPVSFEPAAGSGSASPSSVTTDSIGRAATLWTAGPDEGEDTLRVIVSPVSPVIFTAEIVNPGPPANSLALQGENQVGLVGFAVNIPPSLRITDADGLPVPNVEVTFAVTGGSGSVSGGTVMTGFDGIATVGAWTLGPAPASNFLEATASGVPTLTFQATGQESAYDIEVRFLSSVTPTQEQAFLDAAARWGELVFGDITDILIDTDGDGACGPGSPPLDETVDDLLIFATVDSIDGPGNIAGQAGPCLIRNADTIPVVGRMTFDEADLAVIEAAGLLEELIMHEMGHVIGIGTLWPAFDLVNGAGGSDPHFTGVRGLEAFDRIGGADYTGGEKVPVENEGGQGTRDAHWRESVFDNELMTGVLNAGANPASEETTASLWDLGYLVNLAGSDAYMLDASLRLTAGPPVLQLVNDVGDWPMHMVDDAGRVVRTLDPADYR